MDEDKDEETVEHLRCHISKLENFFFVFLTKRSLIFLLLLS